MIRPALLAILLAIPAVGCKKKAPEPVPPTVNRDTPTKVPDAPEQSVSVPANVRTMAANFARVFFELDSHSLSQDAQDALKANAEIMQGAEDIKVEVQGHADERGTTDYNVALGQKRAEAVKNFLIRSGVAANRVTAISFGEERPVASGANEAAWSKNRRAEFRITWGSGAAGTVQ